MICFNFSHIWLSEPPNRMTPDCLTQLTLLLVEEYVSMAIVFLLRFLFCDYIIIETVPLSCAWILCIRRVVACSRT